MSSRLVFAGQLAFTLLVAAFLIVPAALSMLAGVTVNYFRGIRSGVTLEWMVQVWELYADTIFRSFEVALATLAITLIVGVPAAYALHVRGGRLSRLIEEIITLPLAVPGLAIALALLLTYGGFGAFRGSWLFIVAGHVVFTLPFMVRAVMAVFAAIDIARRNGRIVAYDTNYRPRLWSPARAAEVMHEAMAQADYALPGIDDVQTLTGLTDPQAMLDFYLRLGPRVVVLKMGGQGAWLATPQQRMHISPCTVKVVDATGAGDAFCGSFLARILAGDTPEQAARYANLAAALKCTGYGAVAPIPRAADVIAAMRGGEVNV